VIKNIKKKKKSLCTHSGIRGHSSLSAPKPIKTIPLKPWPTYYTRHIQFKSAEALTMRFRCQCEFRSHSKEAHQRRSEQLCSSSRSN